MAISLQIVEILWTKATRGAPRSHERVALPRAFALLDPDRECRIEIVRMAEWQEFSPVRIADRDGGSPDLREGCLHLRLRSPEALDIAFLGTPASGQPRRKPIPELMRLSPGRFGRVIVNARHSGYSGQHYSETTCNIAFGPRIAADRFVRDAPDALRDLRADLF